jgi:phage host-nuclease inhibitor protein Gam
MTIQEQLDQLADYQSHIAVLALQQQELLDAVQIPAEVQAVHDEGIKRKQVIDNDLRSKLNMLAEEKQAALAAVVVPPEIQAALDEIMRQRNQVELNFDNKRIIIQAEAEKRKAKIDEEFSASVASIYAEINQRKQEISAEFAGKVEAANANIAKLTAAVKAEVIKAGKTIKGKFLQAVYVKGRVTWDTAKLDGLMILLPQLKDARKEGEPSITIRRIG